ncbi:MAG: hypothetical protein ACLQU1_25855 [Bryobacteraceae bacterium]
MMTNHPQTSIVLAIALLTPLSGWAQFRHPRYLHARTDLRRATLLMQVPEEPNVMRDMRVATDQVERAIHELDMAARFDRRDIDEHPPVDVRIGRGSRFREILRLLDGARRDIEQEEDNPLARVWRNRAFGYIDAAMDMVRKGGYDKFRDETAGMPPPPPPPSQMPPPPPPMMAAHPHYLSAIADLRYARALLYRPDWREVMRDQRAAVDEIDRAIGEARQAAIDDGKNPDAHPPIDARMGWEGRFRKAMELLDSAQRDLSMEEDNGAAAAWRARALRNIANARGSVSRAMRDSWWR